MKRSRPRCGSLGYKRVRAKRIYPRVRYWPDSVEAGREGMLGFAGWKAGMTHIHMTDNDAHSPTRGRLIVKPVTILDCPPLIVQGIRYYEKSHCVGEEWVNSKAKSSDSNPKNEKKKYDKVRLIVATQPQKSGMHKKKPDIFEVGVSFNPQSIEKIKSLLGKEVSLKDVFAQGEYIDVQSVTKGHGFTGTVKRFGIRIQTRKVKQMNRHVGSIGSTTPRKVLWQVPMPGQYGYFTRTEFNKRLLMIGDDPTKITPKGGFLGYGLPKSFAMIEGSLPGSKKRLIRLRKAVRIKKIAPVDVKFISLESKQGA